MKTITIHQGKGDDRLEMTVQVSQEEFDKMEEIRKQNPSEWEYKELDLLKAAKAEISESSTLVLNSSDDKTNWKAFIAVILGIALIFIIIAIFGLNKKDVTISNDSPNNILESTNSSAQKDNLEKVYDKLAEWGAEGSYKDFLDFFIDDENRKEIYRLCQIKGYMGTYEQFLEYTGYDILERNEKFKGLFVKLNYLGALNGSCGQFVQWLYKSENRTKLYNKLNEVCAMNFQSQDYFYGTYLGLDLTKNGEYNSRIANCIDLNKITDENFYAKSQENFQIYKSKKYGFSYQYNTQIYKLVNKINKDSHCVMKLESPSDAMKIILVSVWEDVDFYSSYDSDFVERVKQSDMNLGGEIISSAIKTKLCGVTTLKSELKINFMGHKYYAAIYRIIHKQRMYMINIYIPINEYNRNNSYADECIERFKFD